MSVYVDSAKNPVGRMKMCHMLADTVEELHAMVDKIGIPRRFFKEVKYPHYDICQSKRGMAIKNGAIPVSDYQILKIRKGEKLTLKARS